MSKSSEDRTSREYFEETVGHQVSDLEYQRFLSDKGKTGYTLPGLNYEGPGNSLQSGEARGLNDRAAQIHDTQYFDTKWRYDEGEITREVAEQEVYHEDQVAIQEFYNNIDKEGISGLLGAVGLAIKDEFEKKFGTQYPDFSESPKKHMPMDWETTPTKAQKRAGAQQPSTSKAARIADTPSKGGAVEPASVPLPADADRGLDAMANAHPGTAGGQAGVAPIMGGELFVSKKSHSEFSTRRNVYTKSHKFMTHGIAWSILPGTDEDTSFCVGHLAEIPVHMVGLYMTPSEFALLSDGARVDSLHVSVVYRQPATQFQINATETAQAVLNQINDISVAVGLNLTGFGSNVNIKAYQQNKPMIATSIQRPVFKPLGEVYRGMVEDYYGVDNNDLKFTSYQPKVLLRLWTFLYNHFAVSLRNNNANGAKKMFGGWPNIGKYITMMDGKTANNKVVCEYSYKPKLAPLKTALTLQSHGSPWPGQTESIEVEVGNNLVGSRTATITAQNVAPSASVPNLLKPVESHNDMNNYTSKPVFDIYTPIEKSQYCRVGMWGNLQPQTQPSLHVGAQPVPALSTTATLTAESAFNEWTNIKGYWEVTATMVTSEYEPTEYPYATRANVPLGDVLVYNPENSRPQALRDARNDGATVCGLYTNSKPPLLDE